MTTAATAETGTTKDVARTAVRGHVDVEAPNVGTLAVAEGKSYGQLTSNRITIFIDRIPADRADALARMIPIVGANARDPPVITVNATEMTAITRAASTTAVMRGNVNGNAIVIAKETEDITDAAARTMVMTTWRHTLTSSLKISRRTRRRMDKTLMMRATFSFGMAFNGYRDSVKKPTLINGKST